MRLTKKEINKLSVDWGEISEIKKVTGLSYDTIRSAKDGKGILKSTYVKLKKYLENETI